MKLYVKNIILFLAVISACNIPNNSSKIKSQTMQKHTYTNKLIHSNSPYLLQHAHNPVMWYPWGKEALDKAKDEDKLLLVSIGYSACHWCHVMEKESFENNEIAQIMNKHFVCIKVDREERPDIDQIYMNAVQIITGSGGWPLNCFALPDGKPVYGGTYFRPEQWKQVLQGLANTYQADKAKILQVAEELSAGIAAASFTVHNSKKENYNKQMLADILNKWQTHFDHTYGGNNRAPKFPMPNSYELLLRLGVYLNDNKAINHLHKSLDHINRGGIHDQIGGGFARYSTDIYWKVPHFEKMLYDNAQLLSLYSKAYQYSKNPEYKRVVYKTIDFIDRELTAENGAFYSSLDADSEGKEGKFYIWTKREIENILGKDAGIFCDFYNITDAGNWEGGENILYRGDDNHEKRIAELYDTPPNQLLNTMDKLNNKLLKHRNKRIAPSLDNKIIASWNGLMLKGLVDAYRVFGEKKFLETALKNAEFIKQNLLQADYRMTRNHTDKAHRINGFLDDYAFVIDAYIALYQANFEKEWIDLAKHLCDYVLEHFYDKQTAMFFYTSDIDAPLIVRKMEIDDNVIPSSNSAMAQNLYYLSHIFYKDNYHDMAVKMLHNAKENMMLSGVYYSNWWLLMTDYIQGIKEVAIIGRDALDMKHEFDSYYLPNYLFAGSSKESNLPILEGKKQDKQSLIYICKNRVCDKPYSSVKEALKNE